MKTASEWVGLISKIYWADGGRDICGILNTFLPKIIAEAQTAALEEKTAEMAVLALGDSPISPQGLETIRYLAKLTTAAGWPNRHEVVESIDALLLIVDWLIARVDFMARDNGYLEGIERGKVLGVQEYMTKTTTKVEITNLPTAGDPASGWGQFAAKMVMEVGVVEQGIWPDPPNGP